MKVPDAIGPAMKSRLPLIALGALLLFNIIFFAAVLRPQQGKMETLLQDFSTKRKMLASAGVPQKNQKWLLTARKEIDAFIAELPQVSQLAIQAGQLSEILSRQGGLKHPLSFKPRRLEEIALWEYRTAFTITGPYRRIRQIMADIQNSEHLFAIQKLAINNKSKTHEKVELKIAIATYFSDLESETK